MSVLLGLFMVCLASEKFIDRTSHKAVKSLPNLHLPKVRFERCIAMNGIRIIFEVFALALTLYGPAQSITGTYVKEDQVTTLVFSPNGTFSLHSADADVNGRYELKGANLTIKFGFGGLPRKAIFIVVGEDKLVDKEGKQYFRRNTTVEPSTDGRPVLRPRESLNPPIGTPNAGFTNTDVIQLARSGVPDSVIIQKIRSCNCVLDTSTQALIQLQQAGVSAGVMGVMAGGSGGPEAANNLSCTASPATFDKEPQTHSPCYTTENPLLSRRLWRPVYVVCSGPCSRKGIFSTF
jgi:hypothetical protein